MNCTNCNTPLLPGNPVCPNCGTTNDLSSTQTNEDVMVELEEDVEPVQVDANIAPPTLDVNNEDLTQNVNDLGVGDAGETYDPDFDPDAEAKKKPEVVEDLDGDGIPEYTSGDSVNIDIPSVTKPVEVDGMPQDGTAPSVNASGPTLGIVEPEEVKQFKIGGKTIKIKMGKKRNVPQVILLGGVIISLIIGIMIGSTLFKQNVCVSGNRQLTNTDDLKYVADGKNNVTKAGDFTFKIPEGYTYDKLNGGVSVYDSKGTWRIFIKNVAGSYDNIASAKISIEESVKNVGVNIVTIKEAKINDKNHLIIESSKNLVNRLMAFVDAGNDNVFFIEIVNLDNNFNYDVLKVADDIVSNAEFDQKVSYVENVAINDITEIIVTAAEAHKSLNN